MKLTDIARDPSKSEEGIWWNYETQTQVEEPDAERFCLRIAERDNPKYRNAHERLRLAASKRLGPSPDEDTALEALQQVQLEAFACRVLTGWANLDDDSGQPIPYSAETALEMLRDSNLWHLRQFVEDAAGVQAGYMRRAVEAVSGN